MGRGRHCLLLAQRIGNVDHLAAMLAGRGLNPVVLKGGMGGRQRAPGRHRASQLARFRFAAARGRDGPLRRRGFDCPALDTLFLAGPVAFKGRLVQYAGRVLRPHPGKQTAEVHDYRDIDVPVLAAALNKRAPGYLSLGFPDPRKSI